MLAVDLLTFECQTLTGTSRNSLRHSYSVLVGGTALQPRTIDCCDCILKKVSVVSSVKPQAQYILSEVENRGERFCNKGPGYGRISLCSCFHGSWASHMRFVLSSALTTPHYNAWAFRFSPHGNLQSFHWCLYSKLPILLLKSVQHVWQQSSGFPLYGNWNVSIS